MAVIAKWNGIGLADGTVVTDATAGTGDTPWDEVTADAFTVDNSGVHPPRIRMDQPPAGSAQLTWSTSITGALSAFAVRVYVELSDYPASGARLIDPRDSSNVLQWYVDVNEAGLLRLKDLAGVAVDQTAAAIPLDTELRIEAVADSGTVTVFVYAGDATEPLGVLEGTGLGATFQQIRFGNPNASPTWPQLWLGSFAVADTADLIGPALRDTLQPKVELFIGGAWVDVSEFVFHRAGVSVSRGRKAEGQDMNPSECQFSLNNRDGRFSAQHPLSQYYGLIGRNTPVRVSVEHGGGDAYRFHGEVSSWPQERDISGQDKYVPIQAAGITRRLKQGSAPLASPLRRTMATAGLAAYWPCEDDDDAGIIASGVLNGTPMQINGDLRFGDTGAPPGSAGAITFSEGATDRTDVTGLVGGLPSTGGWAISAWLAVPPPTDTTSVAMLEFIASGTDTAWPTYLLHTTSNFVIFGVKPADNKGVFGLTDYSVAGMDYVHVIATAQQNGASIDYALWVNGVKVRDLPAWQVDVLSPVRSVHIVNQHPQLDPFFTREPGSVSHVAVAPFDQAAAIAAAYEAGTGYQGETVGRRLERLAGEEGVPFTSVGDLDDTVPMGPQEPDKLLDLLQSGREVDMGMMFEPRDSLAVGYRTRTTLYNQAAALTLDHAAHELAEPLTAVPDDQATRNDYTAKRSGGSSARVVQEDGPLSVQPPPAGVGVYDDSVTVNVASDLQLTDQAGWRVHLGTVNEARYPKVTVNLRHPRMAAKVAAILAVDVGDRIVIENPPDTLPPEPISLIVQGYKEKFGELQHMMTFTCTPESPYRTGILDDTVLGRMDTAGTVLADAATADATSLTVATTAGPYWEDDAAELPYDVAVGGEVATVTAVEAAVSDGFDRTVAGGWGAAPGGQAWTPVGTGDAASVGGGAAAITHAAAPAALALWLDQATGPGMDVEVSLRVPGGPPADGVTYAQLLAFVDIAAGTAYVLRVGVYADATLRVGLETWAAEQLATEYTYPGLTVTAGTWYRARLRIQGGELLGKIWPDSEREPEWQLSARDDRYTSGVVGAQVFVSGTVPVPYSVEFGEYLVRNPQRMTVTRSVNGIAKPHLVGADVRLAHPMVLAL